MTADHLLVILGLVVGILLILLLTKLVQLKRQGHLNRNNTFRFLEPFLAIAATYGFFASLLYDFNFMDYAPPVEHRYWQQLTLKDFKGLNRPTVTLDGGTEFAFICTTILTEEKDDSIRITSLFHPCRSYIFNQNIIDRELLTHEMYHFHVTEYIARQIRREVSEGLAQKKVIDLQEIKARKLNELNALQAEYDYETYHSYVRSKQVMWQHKIDSFLLSLQQYSNPGISLTEVQKTR